MRVLILALIISLAFPSCKSGPGEGNDNPVIESEIIKESIEEVKIGRDSMASGDTITN